MLLYKYIDLVRPFWNVPLIDGKLYFSSISELQGVNDDGEFSHSWTTPSAYFRQYGHQFKLSYDELFSICRVLCLGKSLNEECFKAFCPSGRGVSYEFEFKEDEMESDITSGNILYDESKNYNVPDYVIKNMENKMIQQTMKKVKKLTWKDRYRVWKFLKTSDDFRIPFEKHIHHELALKKLMKYKYEDEYRFIHLVRAIEPGKVLKTQLINSTLSFSSLSLTLKQVYTTDTDEVSRACSKQNLLVSRFPFL